MYNKINKILLLPPQPRLHVAEKSQLTGCDIGRLKAKDRNPEIDTQRAERSFI